MITVFSSTHGTMLMGAISKIIKQELYTTRAMAGSAISKWITQSFIGGQPWEWSIENERYECTIDGELQVMVVKERTVLDALPEEPTLDLSLWNTPITFKPYSDCAHENCSECQGTGQKRYGGMCIHHLVCHCRKCSPWSAAPDYTIGTYAPNNYAPTTLVPEFDRNGSLISWQFCRTETKDGSGTYYKKVN